MKRKNDDTTFFRNVKPKNHAQNNEVVLLEKFDLTCFYEIENDTY